MDFSNTAQEPQQFSVTNGEWHSLRTAIENTVYDGATQFGALDLKKYPCDEFLLFSDGHSNFGSNDIRLDGGASATPTVRPIYAIVSAAGADYPFLQSIALRSGGELVNLDNISLPKAKEQLLYQNLQFLGVKPSAGLDESYPSLPTTVQGSITVAGISYQPAQQIILQFGYGKKVTIEQKVDLDFSRQQIDMPDLSHVWAQKKIAELDLRYDDNRVEIEQLGRRYGIVTRNTSLVVLENLNDYITYQIEPPADLRLEYDRIMKQRGDNEQQTRRLAANNAETYFDELLHWWGADHTFTPHKFPELQHTDTVAAMLDGRVAGVAVNRAPSGNTMQDVVVIGYGAVRERNLTASVATVRGESADADMSLNRQYMSTRNQYKISRNGGNPGPGTPMAGNGAGSFTAALDDLKTDYIIQLKASPAAERYALYLQLRKDHLHTPLFYFNTANFFLVSGQKATGLRILSNIAELEAESYELEKMLGYKLKELGESEAACAVFKKVMEWRPFEPQSYRDYGLALEDAGHYQQALDTLCYALTKNYDESVNALYPGIEETLLPEINALIAKDKGKLDISRVPKSLLTNMPVDIRVVLNWNRSNTDIDLWVTDPDNEKCYYAHRNTEMGGRISHDFTRGLGPEQFLLKKAVKGPYKVEVNYFGDTQVQLAGETTIMAEVYTNYGTPQQHRSIITLQMQRGARGAVYVGEFDFK